MGKQDIIARILADAESEAEEVLAQAEKRAGEIRAEAERKAETLSAETDAEISERARRITEGKAAAARLDCAKILLSEKRRVIDKIYRRALERLAALGEHDALALYSKLLCEYAQEGEEIVLPERFPYTGQLSRLPVVKERSLKISAERAAIAGGFLLKGSVCDKDVSFEALLLSDREEQQAELAAKIFS